MDDDKPHAEQWDINDPKTQERYERAKAKAKSNGHAQPKPIDWVDTTTDIKQREWHVEDHIPANNVALLSGEGAVGKSILAQQLAGVTALNAVSGHDRDWLGLLPRGGKVEYITCEEDAEEAKRRQEQIAKHYGTTRAVLAQAMRIASWVDNDSTHLMELDRKTDNLRPTDLYHRLVAETVAYRPRLIVLDTAADLFGGSEISRNHTRTFISYVRRLGLAADNGAAVILLTHPSLEGIRSGSGLSGSTAWHNSVRARCVFKHYQEEDEDAGDADPDLRVLEWRKNNYGPAQSTITVRYKNGVYVVEGGSANSLEQQLRERNFDALFLDLLRKRIAQDRPVSDRPGKNYAPTVFADMPEAANAKPRIRARDFTAAMNRLFDAKRIMVSTIGPASKQRHVLVETPKVPT